MRLENNIKFLSFYLNQDIDLIFKTCEFYSKVNLPEFLSIQYSFFKPEKYVSDFVLAVIPDNLMYMKSKGWHQSAPEQKLVLYKKSNFESRCDELGSLVHDLSHIEQYEQIGKMAFNKLRSEKQFKELNGGTYPNNKTEFYAFSKQFDYLKELGVQPEKIRYMIDDLYEGKKEYMAFIDRMIALKF